LRSTPFFNSLSIINRIKINVDMEIDNIIKNRKTEKVFSREPWSSNLDRDQQNVLVDELLDLARREPDLVQPVEVLPLVDAELANQRLRAGDVKGRVVLDIVGGRA
ncbi:MAG: hypothetical protein AAGB00_11715, partial [Planctomycetota bacterium]